MAISDAEYEAWLKRANDERRVVLVEAKAYSSGSEVTRYMATKPFTSRPTDTPANIAYDDIIAEAPYYSAAIPEAFGGNSVSGWGDLRITNENGVRDSWLNDAWDGRALDMYLGDVSWPRNDFRKILPGVSDDIIAIDRTRLALRIRDKSWLLNVPLQTNLIGGTTANLDKLVPDCYGECFNVETPLTVAATHEYQFRDGPAEDVVDVKESGNSIAGAFAEDLSNGKFTLTAGSTGRITADVKGAKPGGVYLMKCADIVEDLVTTRTELAAADLNATSFSDFLATCPQALGIYTPTFPTVASAVDELVRSVGGFWTFDQAGQMILARFDAPSGTPEMELTADDIQLRGLSVKRRIIPRALLRLGYKRNWTVQRDGLAGGLSEADRARLGVEYQVVKAANAGVSTAHLLAKEPPLEGTLLVDAAAAQAEVDRRAALWSVIRFIYSVRCYVAPYKLRLGQVIKVYNDRFGFDAGKLVTLVGYTWFPSKKRAVLELFA